VVCLCVCVGGGGLPIDFHACTLPFAHNTQERPHHLHCPLLPLTSDAAINLTIHSYRALAMSPADTSTTQFDVTVAILQMTACSNISECASEVEARIRAAAAAGADVALTPEMWSMGYAAQWRGGDVAPDNTGQLLSAFGWTRLSEPLDGPYVTCQATTLVTAFVR
jgi:hypothetical protein